MSENTSGISHPAAGLVPCDFVRPVISGRGSIMKTAITLSLFRWALPAALFVAIGATSANALVLGQFGPGPNWGGTSNFANAVAALANGGDDFFRVALQVTDSRDLGLRLGGNDRTYDESLWLPTTSCGGSPDFAGCAISNIELRIDPMTFRKSDPPVDPVQTEYSARLRLRVNGQVIPEPTTALLLALGLAGFAARRRWGGGDPAPIIGPSQALMCPQERGKSRSVRELV